MEACSLFSSIYDHLISHFSFDSGKFTFRDLTQFRVARTGSRGIVKGIFLFVVYSEAFWVNWSMPTISSIMVHLIFCFSVQDTFWQQVDQLLVIIWVTSFCCLLFACPVTKLRARAWFKEFHDLGDDQFWRCSLLTTVCIRVSSRVTVIISTLGNALAGCN